MNRYINNIINNEKSLNDFDSEIPIKETWQSKENNVKKQNKLALNLILKYYKVSSLTDSCMQSENIEYMILNLIPTKGLIYRSIILKNDWYKNGMGAMIGKMRTGETVVFIPKIVSGYKYINCKTKKIYNVTKKSTELFESKAFFFNKSLPKESLNISDFFKYILKAVPSQKYIMLFLSYLVVTLLGLILPNINQYIFSDIISNSSYKALLSVTYVLVGITIVTTLFTIISHSVVYNIRTTISVTTQNALIYRILSLPISFFKEYSSGDITKRLQSFISVISQMIDTILITVLTVLFSLVYIIQITKMTPVLAIPASIITLFILAFIVVFITMEMHVYIKLNKNDVNVANTFFSLLSGIQKIKLARAEERAFNYWNKKYKKSAELLYNPPFILKIQPHFSLIASYVTTIILYYIAATANISVASFMSFTVAFGMVTSALTSLSDVAIVFAQFYSTIELLDPILSSIPDSDDNKQITKKLSGNVELKDVCFKYNLQNKNVFDNFSLKIPSGQYIAITGPTGCGKSTLLRLLLGFEISQSGSVTYDNVNIKDMNLRNLRKQIGTVLQDGKLFTGSIFENITFFEPELTIEDAWNAAEIAGIADDIRNMPMGMFTLISEGDGSISGGQKQRILIARAIVSQPQILILDEATSSLDNITQENLIHSLEKLNCTKIVVAHRLSTVQLCDKIIMLNNGQITEEGTYTSLINKKGRFYNFVLRQQSYSIDINQN
ncbi:ATP-binding cassette domain-containing protein [Clostridium botulinum]|uniref:ATP-binding cassette domain-containing protein n=1 Tax=Clostridium botulinum TaxID=1491 RepID=UPI0001F84ED1|nr:ATP-binding cassette domain-containing protein [Clostridium botulinum]NFB15833.1 ATP-binding cassette domain-containing protein [Clostridium botulinum]NFB66257.1 ATP-binding cassette domain-containing protein [Clostridium botulinum]NFB97055.1 ATP-binding cassette domain-containing protein [Clostridium botulinum]NFC45779.1 ATP-binding cassette domain-containing protein [Clostridium botulinum]NFC57622.1 ATP-binding cassette domain-containing protein [Clostridium botulinum]